MPNFPEAFTPAATTQVALGVNFRDVAYAGRVEDPGRTAAVRPLSLRVVPG